LFREELNTVLKTLKSTTYADDVLITGWVAP